MGEIEMVTDAGHWTPDHRLVLKRMAIQVTAMLPNDQREALAVLAYAAELVNGYLGGPEATLPPRMRIVRIPRKDEESGSAS